MLSLEALSVRPRDVTRSFKWQRLRTSSDILISAVETMNIHVGHSFPSTAVLVQLLLLRKYTKPEIHKSETATHLLDTLRFAALLQTYP